MIETAVPRYPRIFVPEIPLHIVQRGHDRQPVFVERRDFEYYLANLREMKDELSVRLLAYCLMTNHVHLILEPGSCTSNVSKLMRVLAARQTRFANKLEDRTGTLWDGRFRASLVDSDRYLLACYRYVDLNPVRAGVVERPEQYQWSSYRIHAALASDDLIDHHSLYLALGSCTRNRGKAYRQFTRDGISDHELTTIRTAIQRNQLTGGDHFRTIIERRVGRRLTNRGPGRPSRR
ncbi:MAG: transposase [Woeseiaceae bacterium]|nr:transposase [Woeseiaceae bacterium]